MGKEYDCNVKMREWILNEGLAKEAELEALEEAAAKEVRAARFCLGGIPVAHTQRKRKLESYFSQLKEVTHNAPEIQKSIPISKVSLNWP